MNKEEIINELKKDLVYNQYRDTYVIRGENLPFLVERLVKLFCQPVVSNNEAFELCDGVAFANYIEEKWKEYRTITNNEDAWCFKQWLVGK